MPADPVVTVRYRPLKPPEAFFVHGRPLVDPNRPRLFLSRKFDFMLLVGLFISFVALLVHILLVTLTLPELPKATNYVTSQCANMEGEWNSERNVLRFWAVPYAVPPIIKKDASFPEVLYDIAEKFHLVDGGYRWYRTITVPDTEYCFLTFDERCNFQSSQWTCNMHKINRTAACVELNDDGELMPGATEQCLTLDIAMPTFNGVLLPVIVVFTGFRSIRGPLNPQTINEPAYLPTDEAVLKFGAIWVNARYRLGPFGSFYDFNTFGQPEKTTDYVNFGLRDQRAVLLWVQQNIGRFGGDAHKVVVLAHGSGATGALQLITMQAKAKLSEPWFRAVWLASGAVNWYDVQNSKWQKLRPAELLTTLYPCNYGTDPKVLSNSQPCAKAARELLMETDLSGLVPKLAPLYDQSEWGQKLWEVAKFQDSVVPMWFAVDKEFDRGPPLNWSSETIEQIFYENDDRSSPSLAALVFSSMESEYEGFPGLVEADIGEMRYMLDQVTYTEYDGIFDRLETFESIRAKDPNQSPQKLTQQEHLYNALSALRYTCPQAWLFGIWRFNRTELSSGRTRFYHIYHMESPRYIYTQVPGPPGNRRLPFHGLDMLLLTGNYQGRPSVFDKYKAHLWNMFDQFVHEYKMDERCEVQENTEDDRPKALLGCQLTRHGPSRPVTNGTLHSLCSQIDWSTHFNNLAAFE